MKESFANLPAAVTAILIATGTGAPAEEIDFAREVLPVLSNKCFACHGPDAKEKDLRLDSLEAATAERGGYRAIDPANPEDSEVLFRLHDREDPMPPEDAEKQLTAEERELLTRWVRQGGTYAAHWAFVPPEKTPPPNGETNPVDAFILERLEDEGTGFAPAADRRTLARRAALVLTGLPPDPDQLDHFLGDAESGAYGRLVEELMDDPRYGEHQARYWLDAVRYGDTHGLHLDNRRGVYPYRDWIIRAFNRNMPLDGFITWQLAGDLLPSPSLEQLVATGFVRMNPTTSEGGVIPAEFQAKNNFDRVESLGTVLLGMTMTCARCHTHKYDPITQTEYFQLMAFFNNTAESPLDGNSYDYAPVIKAPADHSAWEEWAMLEAQLDPLLAKAESSGTIPQLVEHAAATKGWKTENWRVTKKSIPADSPAPELPEDEEDEKKEDWKAAKGLPGIMRRELLPGEGEARWVAFEVTVPRRQVLWLTMSGGPGSRILVDGKPAPTAEVSPGGHGVSNIPLTIPEGTHEILLKMTGIPETPVQAALENPWDEVAKAGRWEAAAKPNRLLMLADPLGPGSALGLDENTKDLIQRLISLRSGFTTTLVAKELPEPRETRLLSRGEYDHPVGDPLPPGVPEVMGAFPGELPPNRLGLAEWLTSSDHPLVARVLVNRIWQRVFGHGLVRTPEDFGLQGEQPTHPELLDWLAVELEESGWDLRHMLRLMVTSRTFRQDSRRRNNLDDPENRLFARGPGYRLDAEVIRDTALWASELLDPAMGGEGVKPYQPPGLWKALMHPASNTRNYVRDEGDRLYRRSIYVYWKRTSPHPMMTLFDAPDRESSCVRRSRTSTSLQSLGLLNETQRIEMSRKLAERLLRDGQDDDARLDLLFTLLASRPPDHRERKACMKLLDTMFTRYSSSREEALALLSTGDALRDEGLPPDELAAWTQVVVTVLASDVAILLY